MIINQLNIKAYILEYAKAKTDKHFRKNSSNLTCTLQKGNMGEACHIFTM